MRKRVLLLAAAAAAGALFLLAQAPGSKPQVPDLVLANHILAEHGVLDAYGHVSVRSSANPGHYFLARHMPAGAVTAGDILEYDLDSKPVQSAESAGYTERFIHGSIYRARPDVMAVVHFHAAEVIPFGVTGVPLRPVFHMAGFLGAGVPVFDIRQTAGMTDMLIRDNKLGKALADSLGRNAAALMRGHGAVVVGSSLHEVVGRAYYMMVNARVQAEAMQFPGGKVMYLDPEEARKSSAQDGYERFWTLGAQQHRP